MEIFNNQLPSSNVRMDVSTGGRYTGILFGTVRATTSIEWRNNNTNSHLPAIGTWAIQDKTKQHNNQYHFPFSNQRKRGLTWVVFK